MQANRLCKENIGTIDAPEEIDNTVYEDTIGHTISSMMRHISPTETEIQAAEANKMTPSLPVDMVRYLEFLTPK